MASKQDQNPRARTGRAQGWADHRGQRDPGNSKEAGDQENEQTN